MDFNQAAAWWDQIEYLHVWTVLFHPLWFHLDYQRHANYNLTVIFWGVYEKTSPASIAEYHKSDGWNIYKIVSGQ